MEYSPIGTIRSLFPFPTILITQLLKSMLFTVILTNSLTLNPVEYRSSSIALFL